MIKMIPLMIKLEMIKNSSNSTVYYPSILFMIQDKCF